MSPALDTVENLGRDATSTSNSHALSPIDLEQDARHPRLRAHVVRGFCMTVITPPRIAAALLIAAAQMAVACSPTCQPGTIRMGSQCVRQVDDSEAANTSDVDSSTVDANGGSTPTASTAGQSSRDSLGSTSGGMGHMPSSGNAGAEAGTRASSGTEANSTGGKDAGIAGSTSTSSDAAVSSGGPRPAMCGNGVVEMGELCDGNCPTTCPTTSKCLKGELTGSAASCSTKCEEHAIDECQHGDGCCPVGCTFAQDNDCPKSCGDGNVDPPEVCEPTSTSHPCPTSCDDGDPCTNDMLMGSAGQCTATCVHSGKFASGNSRDSCCPKGSNALNDADCDPICGNNIVEPGEQCDGDCPTSCPSSSDPCMIFEVQGTDCSRQCVARRRIAIEQRSLLSSERERERGCRLCGRLREWNHRAG